MTALQIISALEMSLIYGLVALAVYISLRIVDFADLTVDGSFTLGAAVTALMISKGHAPALATLMGTLCGSFAGLVTGLLYVRFKVIQLLAGIITMTALYSVNMRIMGAPNISLLGEPTLLDLARSDLLFLGLVIAATYLLLTLFLHSQIGLALRSSGMNAPMSRSYGVNVGGMIYLGLGISNAFVALAGSLMAQHQGFCESTMGMGTIIIGLASVIIGESLLRVHSLWAKLLTCLLGSIIYRLVVVFALQGTDWGLMASDISFISAAIVTITMIASKLNLFPGSYK